jgi:N-acetylneuraminic acid mutarotase
VPATPGTTTVYVYYGNPSAPSGSDYDSTFTKDFGDTGLLGLYHLDEGAGSATTDASGMGNHGLLDYFTPPFGWEARDGGQWADRADTWFSTGSGLSFDGRTSVVDCGNHGSLDVSDTLTVEAWVKGFSGALAGREQVIASKWGLSDAGFSNLSNWKAFDMGGLPWVGVPNIPTARYHLASAVVDGKIYVFGGYNSGNRSENQVYDPDTNAWTTLAPMPAARYRLAGASLNGIVYAIAGYMSGSGRRDDVHAYDPSTNTWNSKAAIPSPTEHGMACAGGGKLYFMGGYDGNGSDKLHEYDPGTNSWTQKADMPEIKYAGMCTFLNGKIYAFGGDNWAGYSTHAYSYDPSADSWSTLADMPFYLAYGAAVNYDEKIYLGGGQGPSGRTNAFLVYDPSADSWSTAPNMAYERSYHTGQAAGGRIFMISGYRNSGLTAGVLAWAPGLDIRGFDPDGFTGGAFDGRYVYFAPLLDSGVPKGEVVRYDTTGPFIYGKSYDAFDPGGAGVGTDPRGYAGAVFDGRYVYFVPEKGVSAIPHGEVLRFDTQGAFDAAASWAAFSPASAGVGTDPVGYNGGAFDGRYIYFSPLTRASGPHGEVLRLDTQGTFTDTSSWTTFDPGDNGVGTDPDGYISAIFDGRYVYFVPNNNGTGQHGEILRYDTQGSFASTASWRAYDPGAAGVGADADGYQGAAFDGRYIYFSPFDNGTSVHGEVLRYDTEAEFSAPGSWTTFDPAVGARSEGYHGAIFDGRFVYFVPRLSLLGDSGEVVRYDTTKDFHTNSSWAAFDPDGAGLGQTPTAFAGAVSDGRFIYFVPWERAGVGHGEVLRYDTTGGDASYRLSFSQTDLSGARSGGPFGFSGVVSTDDGAFTVSSNTQPDPGTWHHVAMTYDGSVLSLYVDGALAATTTATGNVLASQAALQIGSFMDSHANLHGEIDEVRIYNRALSAGEVGSHFQRRKYSANEPTASAPGTEEKK